MKLSDLVNLPVGAGDAEIAGISADSRQIKPGFIFAALAGTVVDGREYIPQAENNGAVAIIAEPDTQASIPLLSTAEPRLLLAQLAARFHAGQPEMTVGITGTNGKTSIARFCQQLWSMLGHKAGSLGTLGAFADGYEYTLRHTTPDPVEIHQVLSTMATLGTTHLAMEVSSHGLSQYRADGVKFSVAAFTNITRDHLDYHPDFEDYFAAKARLFTELLPEGHTAVINMDGAESPRVAELVRQAGRRLMSVGRQGQDIRLLDTSPLPDGQQVSLVAEGKEYTLKLPLVGYFQAENALVAAGVAVASGHDISQVMPLLERLNGAPGRMEHIADKKIGHDTAGVYVDYAHTPDAIETALKAIRPHTTGKVIIIIGAGGDRDKVKRPQMGTAAAALADEVIVTDDNPRTEDPATIRAEVMQGCPQAIEVADRREAIASGLERLAPGDILLIAGKGHETGQTVGTITMPFNDADVARDLTG
ncbi:UDP-N-acetylmuramoyl-L-alanyl-D-glutamate--2,6-diaminopimelate ligase [Parvularcula sp. IMCC14364]|uniref:UDP-N-acetylmuramoyl-L-alanyl-D-glutamate--2, 6-diaminopimelate ligase n=1 Tax=Parvularcula sp. IMCC14364 TaxID=3067902 RepID=UPI0027405809|nr:UDP-N-acetylmuramoyl-L-alanyl-D-glutamate--2,6-diaminopimelate ligase [Parvularcula sp. IMCC14364]